MNHKILQLKKILECRKSNFRVMTVETRQDVIKLLKTHQDELNKFGVIRLGLFGSFVRNTAKSESDVDILDKTEYLILTSHNLSKDSFLEDETLKRAFIRSLEIIGEAVKPIT